MTLEEASPGEPSGARPRAVRILGGLFFAIFAVGGLVIAIAVLAGFREAVSVWTWDEVECTIEFSKIVDHETSEERFELEVEYRYEVRDRIYRGANVDLDYGGSNDPAETQRLADRYASGARATCLVDPNDPERSFLRRPSLMFGFAIALPLVFVVSGAVGLWLLWRPRPPGPGSAGEPISGRTLRPGFSWTLISWIFFLVGGALGAFFVLPGLEVLQARGWHETPCVILESGVGVHYGDDGATYTVDVIYSYEVQGRKHKSSRYRFLGGSSSGKTSKQAVVDRLSPGTVTRCWVNPNDPYEAVLDRSLGWEFLFVILPLVFLALGTPGVVMSVFRGLGRASKSVVPSVEVEDSSKLRFVTLEDDEDVYDDNPYRESPAPLTLEPTISRGGSLALIVVLALIWNGILSIFLWFLINEWLHGNFEWLVALFLSPFVLVGLLLLIGIPHQILAQVNPRPVLTLTPGRLRVGGTGRLDWRFRGAAGRLSGLQLQLEGKESATRTSGDSSHTATEVFHSKELVTESSLLDFERGSVRVEIPESVMHSFDAGNNKVVWTLKLRGKIRFWPDVTADFELRVVPPEGSDH